MKKTAILTLPLALLLGVLLYIKFTPAGPDYIFLITLDTTRADHIDYSLEDNKLTPNLARLASKGIYFSNAYSVIPITLPSHAAMFYSLSPYMMKVYNNGQSQDVSLSSLAEIMKDKGYQTGAVVSLGVLLPEFKLDKGFDEYITNFKPNLWYKTAGEVNQDAYKLIDKMKEGKSFFWIHYSDPHEPYFPPLYSGNFYLYLNNKQVFSSKSIEKPFIKLKLDINPGINSILFKTEVPDSINKSEEIKILQFGYHDFSIKPISFSDNIEIVEPKEWNEHIVNGRVHYYSQENTSQIILRNKSKEDIGVDLDFFFCMTPDFPSRKILYEKEVKYMDEEFGHLIDFLMKNNLFEKSLFIVMGDHGEGLGEHKHYFGHIHYLNKHHVKAPLIVAGRGVKQTGVRKELVSNYNVAPTILDVLNIKLPKHMIGKSLLKSLHSNKLLLETYSPEAIENVFSIIEFPYQLIFYPERTQGRFEFYNLEADALGINNTLGTSPDEETKSALIESITKISEVIIASKGKPGIISKQKEEILKSLGYIK